MIPGSLLGLCVVFALIPGSTYVRLTRRCRIAGTPSPLEEFVLIVACGLAATVPVATALSWLAQDSLQSLVDDPTNVHAILLAALLLISIVALATGASVLVAVVQTKFFPAVSGDSVWNDLFSVRGSGFDAHLDITLRSNETFSGWLRRFDESENNGPRYLALEGSVMTGPKGTEVSLDGINSIVIAEVDIKSIAVSYRHRLGERMTTPTQDPLPESSA